MTKRPPRSVSDAQPPPREMLPARLPRARVPATYRWIAPVHDLLAKLVERTARAAVLDLANVQNGAHVLEVAVGTGLSFVDIVDRNPDGISTGVDITPAMLLRAKRRVRGRAGDFRLIHGDAYSLPFEAALFDVVVNTYMLDMVPAPDFPGILSEFRRVLRPDGRLVIGNMAIPRRAYQGIWDLVYSVYPPLLGGCRGIDVKPALIAAGFKIQEVRFISELTFPSEVVLAYAT